jgi:hypothetical protein
VGAGRAVRDDVLGAASSCAPPRRSAARGSRTAAAEQVPVGHRAARQVGPDAAVVHDGDVGAGGVPLRVRDQTPERVLGAGPMKGNCQPSHRTRGDLGEAAFQPVHQPRQAGVGAHRVGVRRHQPGPHLHPRPTHAHEVREGDRVAARTGLHDGDAVDARGEDAVVVAGHDQVDRSRVELAGDVDHRSPASRRVALRALVCQHHHEIGRCARLRQHARIAAGSPKAGRTLSGRVAWASPVVSDHGDLHRAACDDGERLDPRRPGARRVRQVGGQERIARLGDAGAERVHRPVELVIADGRGVDPEPAQGVDGRAPPGEVRQRRPGHLIARIQPHRRAAAIARQTVEPRTQRGRAPHETTLGPAPRPRRERPVEVGDREDAQQRAVRRAHRWRRRGEGLAGGLARPGRGERPARPIEGAGLERAQSPDLVRDEVAHVLCPVVDHGGAAQHGVPATALLPVAVERERERIAGRHRAPPDPQPADALARGATDVDHVLGAVYDVEVVAGDATVDDRPPGCHWRK